MLQSGQMIAAAAAAGTSLHCQTVRIYLVSLTNLCLMLTLLTLLTLLLLLLHWLLLFRSPLFAFVLYSGKDTGICAA